MTRTRLFLPKGFLRGHCGAMQVTCLPLSKQEVSRAGYTLWRTAGDCLFLPEYYEGILWRTAGEFSLDVRGPFSVAHCG